MKTSRISPRTARIMLTVASIAIAASQLACSPYFDRVIKFLTGGGVL